MAVATKSDKEWSFQEVNDLITDYEKSPYWYNLHLVIIKTGRKRKRHYSVVSSFCIIGTTLFRISLNEYSSILKKFFRPILSDALNS